MVYLAPLAVTVTERMLDPSALQTTSSVRGAGVGGGVDDSGGVANGDGDDDDGGDVDGGGGGGARRR
jgi:hypothetical protein